MEKRKTLFSTIKFSILISSTVSELIVKVVSLVGVIIALFPIILIGGMLYVPPCNVYFESVSIIVSHNDTSFKRKLCNSVAVFINIPYPILHETEILLYFAFIFKSSVSSTKERT